MHKVLEVIYKNGVLILDKDLGIDKEGKKFKIFLFDEENREEKKKRFFNSVEKHSFSLPEDYVFNREEAHER